MKTGKNIIESNLLQTQLACNINSAVFNIHQVIVSIVAIMSSNVCGIQLPLVFAVIYIIRQLNVMEYNFRSIHPGVEVPLEAHSRYTRFIEAVYESC